MTRLVAALLLLSAVSLAQDAGTKGPLQFQPADIKFADAPKLPPRTQIAVLEGNPQQSGLFTLRLKIPPKFELPLHTHPQDERVTVLEGAVFVKLEGKPAKKFAAGSFYVTPPGVPHEVYSEEGAVLQMTGVGPWVVTPVAKK